MKQSFLTVASLFIAICGSSSSAAGVRDFLKKNDSWYATGEARRIATNVLSFQADLGGWPKNTDTATAPFIGPRKDLKPTFDNNATTDELRFLARMHRATKDQSYRAAVEKGFD